MILWALLFSGCIALICGEPLVGLGGLTATAIFAILRKEEDSLPLLVCLAYQWLFVCAGVLFRGVYGTYPNDRISPSLDVAVVLLLSALLAMAVGIWAALRLCARTASWERRRSWISDRSNYAVDKLFMWVLVLFAGSWVSTSNPKQVAYSVSQILYRLLEFRTVFLFLLILMVLRRRQGRLLALLAGVFVTLPMVTGGGSGFSYVLILVFAALFIERKSLFTEGLRTERNRRTLVAAGIVAFALANLAILWQGAIKPAWRPIARGGELEASRIERIAMFFDVAWDSTRQLDWNLGLSALAKRTSDVPMMMALVLDRVPAQVPHESGALTMRAIRHVAMPRFLFPDKENLGSDSPLVRHYTGLIVAGEAEGTSIGLGYIVEFYIDYGLPGMFAAAFLFGCLVGCLHRVLLFVVPSLDLYHASTTAILLQHFMSLDGSLAKIQGGLIMSYAVWGALFALLGAGLHKSLLSRSPAAASLRVQSAGLGARNAIWDG